MHNQLVNELRLDLTISVVQPLLIRGQNEFGSDPTRPEIQCVRTGGVVYLPGTSLRGMLRQHVERINRTLEGAVWSCNPLGDRSERNTGDGTRYSCNAFFKSKGTPVPPATEIYRESCTTCRLFGNRYLASRISIADAYPNAEVITENRHTVAIDRVLGEAIPASKSAFEVIMAGSFETVLTLKNFTLGQFGLLAIVLRDLQTGQLRLGAGRSRGLGQIKADVTHFSLRYPACRLHGDQLELLNGRRIGCADQLYGAGALSPLAKDYFLSPDDRTPLPEHLHYTEDIWRGVELILQNDIDQTALWRCGVERWRMEVANEK
ncbi:MAG: hypothetical protein D6675_06245 [Gemmatimonadetes bacterium]|nr:MAG: hypothetical protein D6675_06245 [Gemmatimonadota bacterium]